MLAPVRLLVVDHHPRTRYQLERVLDAEPGFVVVAQWVNGSDTARLADEHRPDVLLLDLDMPGRASMTTLAQLAALPHPVRTLGLCAQIDNETILRVFDLGGHGVIGKDSSKDILFKSIHTVARGRYWVAPEHVAMLIDRLRERALPDAQPSVRDSSKKPGRFRLTPRELDIVAGVALGESNKEIAERLSVKECTVKHHLSSVFDKVGVFSRLQLAVFAIHHHLVEIAEFLR